MKKQRAIKNNIAVVSLLLCLGWGVYMFSPLTSKGATRLAMLLYGYPVEAVTSKLEQQEWSGDEIVYFVSNPPYAETTDTTLFQWNVKKAHR